MMRPARLDTSWSQRSPAHDASVIASPATPGQLSSAPNQTNTPVAAPCQTRWNAASSVVNQPAKKLSAISCQRREGQYALTVNQAPTRLTARNAQPIPT